MDSFNLRMKFRQQIRRKNIEQIKREKRKVILVQNRKFEEEKKTQQLYKQMIRQSYKIFEQPLNYLQMLKQALHWRQAHHFAQYFPNCMLSIIKYYETQKPSDQETTLLMECIAMIYYHSSILFEQITLQAINISLQQLKEHINMKNGKSKYIKNRCLTCLQNITCVDSEFILQYCTQQKKILECLQNMLEDFPNENQDKQIILKIYTNLIDFQIFFKKQHPYAYFYPNLLLHCFQENYEITILQQSVNIVCSLIKNKQCDIFEILESTQSLFISLSMTNFYVNGVQQLLSVALQYLVLDCNLDRLDFALIEDYKTLLQNIVESHSKQAKPKYVCKSFKYMQTLEFKVEDSRYSPEIIIRQIKSLCDYWTDLQIEFDSSAELYMLQFLQSPLSDVKIIQQLYFQAEHGMVNQKNAINAPTWEIIMQFLIQVSLQESQKMLTYLLIFQHQSIWQRLLYSYRQSLVNKIEGCRYCNNDMIAQKAQLILKIGQQSLKHTI